MGYFYFRLLVLYCIHILGELATLLLIRLVVVAVVVVSK